MEILQNYVLQENKRYQWMRSRFLGKKEIEEEDEGSEDEQSPRVAGSPLPSKVSELRQALQARLEALRTQDDSQTAEVVTDEALDEEPDLQRLVAEMRESRASSPLQGDASSSSDVFQASNLRRRPNFNVEPDPGD